MLNSKIKLLVKSAGTQICYAQQNTPGASGIFKQVCIFCKQKTKSKGKTGVERLGSSAAPDAEERIKEAANILEDHEMITKIGDIDFVAKEVKYHHSCRKTYLNRAERTKQQSVNSEEKKDSEYHKLRLAHERAFSDIIAYIQDAVVDNERAELLTSLHERYMVYLAEHGCSDSNYAAQTLASKLLKHFKGKLAMGKSNKRQGNVIYSSKIEKSDAVKHAFDQAKRRR